MSVLTPANDLRPGDVIMRDGHPADLIEVVDLQNGYVELIWGVGGEDRAVLAGDVVVEVVGRFNA